MGPKMLWWACLAWSVGLAVAPNGLRAEDGERAARNAEARRRFEDAKFGLFINWGVYSLIGKGEWVMEKDRLPIVEYEKLPPRFNPTEFEADAWVKTAKSAGMRYITVTAKHHDGFCMFDSKLTRYDVVDATPFARDPLKALADAARKQGITLFFYYSLLDWHHPDYWPLGKTGKAAGREDDGDWSSYVAYYQGQVRELCTNYGEIGGIWFDGSWDRPDADWDLEKTYAIVHDLQPGALVGNNHHAMPRPGEDFEVSGMDPTGRTDPAPDRDLTGPAATRPRQTCLSMNRSWGHNASDRGVKTAEQVIDALLSEAGRGANLLLNVGPKAEGAFGSEFVEPLLKVGSWLDKNGESVYGTRRGPFPPQPWGVSTRKPDTGIVYLHATHPERPIEIPPQALSLVARPFAGVDPLAMRQTGGGVVVELPEALRTPIDTIIVLTPRVLPR